jgi:hypothetical protein
MGHRPCPSSIYTRHEQFSRRLLIGIFGLGSDGSVKGLSTTYSSRIQSRSSLHNFITSHSKSEPTSTLRAEAYGYLGCLYLLCAAVTYLLSQGHTIAIPPIHGQFRSPHQTILRPSCFSDVLSTNKTLARVPSDCHFGLIFWYCSMSRSFLKLTKRPSDL